MTAEVPWNTIATIVSILAAFAGTTRWMLNRVDDRIERVENRSDQVVAAAPAIPALSARGFLVTGLHVGVPANRRSSGVA